MSNFVYSKVLPASTTADADDVNQNFDDVRNFALGKTLHRDGSVAMLAPLRVPFDPTLGSHAVRKSYTDARKPGGPSGNMVNTVSLPTGTSQTIMQHSFQLPAQPGILTLDMRLYLASYNVPTAPLTAIVILQTNLTGTFGNYAVTRESATVNNEEVNLACQVNVAYPASVLTTARVQIDITGGGSGAGFNTIGDGRFSWFHASWNPYV